MSSVYMIGLAYIASAATTFCIEQFQRKYDFSKTSHVAARVFELAVPIGIGYQFAPELRNVAIASGLTSSIIVTLTLRVDEQKRAELSALFLKKAVHGSEQDLKNTLRDFADDPLGVDGLNIKDDRGFTVLHNLLGSHNNPLLIDKLTRHGADPTLCTPSGENSLQIVSNIRFSNWKYTKQLLELSIRDVTQRKAAIAGKKHRILLSSVADSWEFAGRVKMGDGGPDYDLNGGLSAAKYRSKVIKQLEPFFAMFPYYRNDKGFRCVKNAFELAGPFQQTKKDVWRLFHYWQEGKIILLESGFNIHSSTIILRNHHVVFCDRTKGITKCSFNQDNFSIQTMEKLITMKWCTQKEAAQYLTRFMKEMQCVSLPDFDALNQILSFQIVGNCSLASIESTVLVLLMMGTGRKNQEQKFRNWSFFQSIHFVDRLLTYLESNPKCVCEGDRYVLDQVLKSEKIRVLPAGVVAYWKKQELRIQQLLH